MIIISKVRYIIAIIVAIAVTVAMYFLLSMGYGFDILLLLFSYCIGAMGGDFILGYEGLAFRLFLLFVSWIPSIFYFWVSLFTFNIITIIIAIALFTPCLTAIFGILFFAIALAAVISSVTFIIHIITYAQDLY